MKLGLDKAKRFLNKCSEKILCDSKSSFFGKSNEKWDWENFKSTEGFPVSKELMDWIVGQDHAIKECKLCIDEWIHKLVHLKKKEWWKAFENPMGHKPSPKEMLPAGPFLLMLGDAGTGKSLLGRAMQSYMTELYQKNGIEPNDVLSWQNKRIPSEPKISIHPAGAAKDVIMKDALRNKKKTFISKWGVRILQGLLLGLGIAILSICMYLLSPLYEEWGWFFVKDSMIWMKAPYNFINRLLGYAPLLVAGASLTFFGFFIGWITKIYGNMGGSNTGGASSSDSPKILVDNSSKDAPYVDATGHGSAQLFGSIAWDPYQTGGLGTPEHQRVSAGDVHRAHLGILFIDEIKNLVGMEAITLLTVLEDGQLPIALRSQFHGGDTAAMSVATEPVPCMFFLIAAGNLDSLPNIHPALLDRIQGYGKTVYMSNEMEFSVENRRKYVQFISQEVKRFNLLPFSRDSCIAVIEEARRRSGRNDQLTCKFRPMIGTIKTASVLARNEGCKLVEEKHVKEALSEHCKSIGIQIMEKYNERNVAYMHIDPHAKPKIGLIHGLAVSSINNENTDLVGSVLSIRASCVKSQNKKGGYFNVTGVDVKEESYVQQSIKKIYHIIRQLYGKNLSRDYCTHIDFSQKHGVEGPSAGAAMTLALISCLTNRKIRQDVAVTGEINIGCGSNNKDKIIITPIGGVHEKIMAAQIMGFKKVCIPKRNFDKNIIVTDYNIKVVSCETLEDYIRECLEP